MSPPDRQYRDVTVVRASAYPQPIAATAPASSPSGPPRWRQTSNHAALASPCSTPHATVRRAKTAVHKPMVEIDVLGGSRQLELRPRLDIDEARVLRTRPSVAVPSSVRAVWPIAGFENVSQAVFRSSPPGTKKTGGANQFPQLSPLGRSSAGISVKAAYVSGPCMSRRAGATSKQSSSSGRATSLPVRAHVVVSAGSGSGAGHLDLGGLRVDAVQFTGVNRFGKSHRDRSRAATEIEHGLARPQVRKQVSRTALRATAVEQLQELLAVTHRICSAQAHRGRRNFPWRTPLRLNSRELWPEAARQSKCHGIDPNGNSMPVGKHAATARSSYPPLPLFSRSPG